MSDRITAGLGNPLGYYWVERARRWPLRRRWGWEARRHGWGVDAGFARTKRGAIRAAENALRETA